MGHPNSLDSLHIPQGGQAMGRGRAKAKQTKVARQLKYNTHEMDLDSLQRELATQGPRTSYRGPTADDDVTEEEDPYAEYAEWSDDDDEGTQDVSRAPR
ncbi:DUF3073 domain-containing protein [Corynebacterium alimapuense]|uniref:DUF3073 domain-containing protein n=2 Tax=Corynebacterium alimapuense TaxID=1576874 RepID=A0A3M8K9J8_9CORY|nr:DUF3073 domain-containing protein [Corynebacterium alimapuense]